MARQSKRFKFLAEQVANLTPLDVSGAVAKLKALEPSLPKGIKHCKFDQTVEVAVRLGVDTKQADQTVRGSIVLPHGIGKSKRVLVFAQGDNAATAQKAGADFVGGAELAEKSKGAGPISTWRSQPRHDGGRGTAGAGSRTAGIDAFAPRRNGDAGRDQRGPRVQGRQG